RQNQRRRQRGDQVGTGDQGAAAARHRPARRHVRRVRPLHRQRDGAVGQGQPRGRAEEVSARAGPRLGDFAMNMLCRPAALALAALCLFAAPAAAQDYPNRPGRVLLGRAPGAAADIAARVVGTRLTQILGQQVVVENKPGAGSNLAADYVSHAAKDGYTLLIGTSANLTNAVITPNLGFDFVKDFSPIALITTAPVILVVNPSLCVNSVQELVALAKKKPGEINYGSTGVGAAPHLAGELFKARTGINLVHVPYQGSPQAVTDLLAGRVSVMFSPASAVIAHVKAGKLKALA